MRNIVGLVILGMLLQLNHLWADVYKKTRSEVEFIGLGKMTSTADVYLKGNRQLSVTEQSFKGEGFIGKLVGKMFSGGQRGDLLNLDEKKMYTIQYEKKKYRVTDLTSLFDQDELDRKKEKAREEEETGEKDDIEIIKNEIRVENLGQTRTIAGRTCKGTKIIWDYEAINHTTDEHTAMQGEIVLWNAPEDAELKKMKAEEMQFSGKYMEVIGLDKDWFAEDKLGLQWFKIMNSLKQAGKGEKGESEPKISGRDLEKIKKIEGYPLLVEGKFRTKDMNRPEGEEAKMEEDEDNIDVSKGLGGFLGGKLKKSLKKEKQTKSSDGWVELFSFTQETISFSTANVPDDQLTIPSDFQKEE